MKNQVAVAWQVWICVLPIHSKSVSLTDQADKPNLRGQTHKQVASGQTLSASEQKYSVVNTNIDYRKVIIQGRSRF